MSGLTFGVVGGGMLGLTLALRLRQRGHHVTLFEAAGEIGGLASAWSLGDVTWDRHYHVTLLSDACLRRVLDELGLSGECVFRETKTGCYADGRVYSVSNTFEFLRFPPLSLLDKARLAATIVRAARIRDALPLEDVPVEDWLIRWSGRRAYERFWLPLLRSKLGDNVRETSAAFIWATIQRLYAARRSGLKKEYFGYVRGGYRRVLERFAVRLAELQVEVRRNARTERIEREGAAVVVTTADGARSRFDRVVCTPAAPVAAALCPGLTAAERERLAEVRYQGIVCASLVTTHALSPYYVTNLLDPTLPFTGVIEMTALVDPSELGGRHLIYLPRYVAASDPLVNGANDGGESDAAIRARFLDGLKRMHSGFDPNAVLDFRVSRVRYVHALSTLGYSRRLPPMKTSVEGLFVVNSAHIVNGTLNVNETVALAERALPVLVEGAA